MNLLIRSAFIIVAIIAVVAAVLLMSTGSREDPSVEPQQKSQQETTTMPNDTIKDTTEYPDRPLSLPPGHARVEITITDIQNGQLTAEVHRVIGHGSSTKPVSSGKQLNISADTYLKNSSVDTTALKGKRLKATISMRRNLSLKETAESAEWVLVKLAEYH